MSREFLDFVEDILDAMNKAENLLEGVSYSQFEDDFRTSSHFRNILRSFYSKITH